MLLVWSLAALTFWLLITADRKRHWPAELRLDPSRTAGAVDDVAVCVPARNEADVVRECLPSLLRQRDDFVRLVFVDDRSIDGTGDRARELVDRAGCGDRAEVRAGAARQPGWSGKLHALDQAVDTALSGAGADRIRWLLLTDADVRHPDGSIRALRGLADREGYDMVSVMVRLHAGSLWERVLIPLFVYFFQLLYPFRRVRDDRSSCAAAAGGCVLIARELYERIGGVAAIRGAIIDDVSLARRAKDAGGKLWLGHCREMVSVRRYERFGEIADMVARTAFTQLRHSYVLLALCLVWLLALIVAPPFLVVAGAVTGQPIVVLAALATWALQAFALLPVVRHHGVAWGHALTLPFGSLAYAWMTALSGWRHLRGRGVRWREPSGESR